MTKSGVWMSSVKTWCMVKNSCLLWFFLKFSRQYAGIVHACCCFKNLWFKVFNISVCRQNMNMIYPVVYFKLLVAWKIVNYYFGVEAVLVYISLYSNCQLLSQHSKLCLCHWGSVCNLCEYFFWMSIGLGVGESNGWGYNVFTWYIRLTLVLQAYIYS